MSVVQETVQTATQIASAPKRRRRVGKILLICASAIVAVALAAQLTFTFSGSGKWQYMWTSRHGVALYSMKVPGDNYEKFKAVWRIKSTLSRTVAFMEDPNSTDISVDFYDSYIVGPHTTQAYVTTWKSGFPWPFKPRDFVVRNYMSQDPKTGTVVYTLDAVPNALPRNSCCVRVTYMKNKWLLTPKGNGVIEVQWMIDMTEGGMIPYILTNLGMPGLMAGFAKDVESYANRKKYWDAKYAWLHEPDPGQLQ